MALARDARTRRLDDWDVGSGEHGIGGCEARSRSTSISPGHDMNAWLPASPPEPTRLHVWEDPSPCVGMIHDAGAHLHTVGSVAEA